MPDATLKIEHARYILTVDAERRIVSDGSIVIEGQRIAHVGKADALADVPAQRVIDAREMVVTPGFSNGHMHISYAHAVRGIFPDDVEGRLAYVFLMQSVMTEEEEYYTSLLAITELLKGGTTSFLDPGSTKFPDACMQAYEDSGCRIILGDHVTDRPNQLDIPTYSTADAIARMEDRIRRYDGRLAGRVRAWTMPFSMALCSDELLVAAKRLADEHGTGMTMHHGGGLPREGAEAQRPLPTERLAALGVLGPNVLLAHAMLMEDAEIELLAETGASVAMCPSTVIKEGGGIARGGRMPEMLERGVNVALGSDSVNSSNYLDMVRSMNLAATLYKDARRDLHMIPAETALELATIGGARALGAGDELGSIEEGKKADLVLFDTRRPEWRALINPVNNLVYSADASSVHTVIVDGRPVVEAGRAQFVDAWPLIQEVEQIGARIAERAGVSFPQRWPVI